MLIVRTKPIERTLRKEFISAREVRAAGSEYGALFTPETAKNYLFRLLEWVEQNAWDAETYFIDHSKVLVQLDGYAPEATEAICTAMLRSADAAIQEAIHTLSDLCARSTSYTFTWGETKTSYAPTVSEIIGLVQEQVELLNKFVENPRYDEIYRRYAGHAGPWHTQVDADYTTRVLVADDPLVDALDGIFVQACNLLDRLGPHFSSAYTSQYPFYGGSTAIPNGYKNITDTDGNKFVSFYKNSVPIVVPASSSDTFRALDEDDTVILSTIDNKDITTDTPASVMAEWTSPIFTAQQMCIAVQDDRKFLVGGISDGLQRFHATGTLDASFDHISTPGETIYAVVVQSDGKIVYGGTHGIFRVDADGVLDTTFTPPDLSSGTVYAIAMYGSSICVGGSFTSPHRFFMRLNANGTDDTSFNTNASRPSFAGGTACKSLCVVSSYIWVGGDFTDKISQINSFGSGIAGFSAALPSLPSVKFMATSGGRVYTCRLRLNTNGTQDTAWYSGAADDDYRAMFIQGTNVVMGKVDGTLERFCIAVPCVVDSSFITVDLENTVHAIVEQEYIAKYMLVINNTTGFRVNRLRYDGERYPNTINSDLIASSFGVPWVRKIKDAT